MSTRSFHLLVTSILLMSLTGCQRIADRYIEDYLQRREAAARPARVDAPKRPSSEQLLERFTQDLKRPVSVPLDSSPTLGSSSSPRALVAFLDFQCPFSKKLLPTLSSLVKTEPATYRLVFKHLPLASHPRAAAAALAAIAAQNQGKFWEMAELLFDGQDNLTEENFLEWAGRLGLDKKRFAADMKSPLTAAKLSIDKKVAESLGIRSTPVTFVDGAPIRGALPPEALARYLVQDRQTPEK